MKIADKSPNQADFLTEEQFEDGEVYLLVVDGDGNSPRRDYYALATSGDGLVFLHSGYHRQRGAYVRPRYVHVPNATLTV